MRHGEGSASPTWDDLLSDDTELHLVHADPMAWMDAHPCSCDALCKCEGERAQDGYVNPTGGKTTGRERKDA
jgi:hypothetical protein